VFFEAARRLAAFLAAAETALGAEREATIGRELTKRHEEIIRGRLGELRERIAGRDLRGEVTLLIAGAAAQISAPEAADVDAEIRAGRAAGRGLRELSAEIARRTGPRREIYRRALPLERDSSRGKRNPHYQALTPPPRSPFRMATSSGAIAGNAPQRSASRRLSSDEGYFSLDAEH
jgi:16S rRNA (cytidine1402-2'-O)-methyltransferase